MFTQISFEPAYVAQHNSSTVRNESGLVCMPRHIPHPPPLLVHLSYLTHNTTHFEFLLHLILLLFPLFLLLLFPFLFLL